MKTHTNCCIIGTSGSIVVCISPLISLMMDQRAKYSPKGLQIEYVGAEQTDPLSEERVLKGNIQLV